MKDALALAKKIKSNVSRVIVGKEEVIDLLLVALLCEGHVLVEDVPGVGKTTLVSALAKSVGLSFGRIQFTPDVLASDITGFSMANMRTGDFEYKEGMVMKNIILADEINRTSPKTQSSLLEVMEERQITVDGSTYDVPRPFMVLATQNPVEYIGTYPLPEAQMDRFLLRVTIGYPSMKEEAEILTRFTGESDPRKALDVVVTPDDIVEMQEQAKKVFCAEELKGYISRIAARTREHESLSLGISPRGSIYLLRAAQAKALLAGRDYIIPDDIQDIAVATLAHRLVVKPEARLRDMTAERILHNILNILKVPVLGK